MRYFIILIFITTLPCLADNIYVVNSLKEKAEQHYKNNELKKALECYKKLVEREKVKEGNVLINYAHILLQSSDTLSARGIYTQVIKHSKNPTIRSKAYSQAAYIELQFNKNREECIKLLKTALIENDKNHVARHNLVLVLNKKAEDQSEEQDSKNRKGGGRSKSRGSSMQMSDIEKVENETDDSAKVKNTAELTETDRTPKLDMSLQKAQQILDAMQKNELQYIQQLYRKEEDQDSQHVNKPSW